MNWRYAIIIVVLAALVGGAALWLSVPDGIPPVELPQKPEKIECIGDIAIIRNLDKELILEKIAEGKEFLYKMVDENEGGFHKYYYALDDTFEERLHAVYSASIIYTFLYLYDLENDEEILKHLPDWGNFLLSMQNKNERPGAFHYSYYLNTKEKEQKFVVGTAALSIFTLLRLYGLTGDGKYLESAKLAGDWLLTMQESDGGMQPYVRYSDGRWVHGTKESLLYNGQTLSSLSKLYQETGDERYFETAERIAQRFAQKYEEEQGFIEGEYRDKNPISNAWVVMSLTDFYNAGRFKVLTESGSYKAKQNDYYLEIIFPLAEKVLEKQKDDSGDLLNYGGFGKVYSSSGVGWISEVMAETYRFCREQGRDDCGQYKEAAIKAIRWLLQSTYSRENSSFLENPERAIGGVFWNEVNKYVRTDSVCHALNGYIRIWDFLEDGVLLSIPKL